MDSPTWIQIYFIVYSRSNTTGEVDQFHFVDARRSQIIIDDIEIHFYLSQRSHDDDPQHICFLYTRWNQYIEYNVLILFIALADI